MFQENFVKVRKVSKENVKISKVVTLIIILLVVREKKKFERFKGKNEKVGRKIRTLFLISNIEIIFRSFFCFYEILSLTKVEII